MISADFIVGLIVSHIAVALGPITIAAAAAEEERGKAVWGVLLTLCGIVTAIVLVTRLALSA